MSWFKSIESDPRVKAAQKRLNEYRPPSGGEDAEYLRRNKAVHAALAAARADKKGGK